mgnify:CR=1 FL=1
MILQNTIKDQFFLKGRSLHRGELVNLKVLPAPAGFGIQFRRVDVREKDPFVKAIYSYVSETHLCTKITNKDGISIQTIEHLMAALAGTGIHNVLIEVDGPELPILDGSSREFVKKILDTGKKELAEFIDGYKIKKVVQVSDGAAWARFTPSERFSIEFHIDYSGTVIGKQNLALSMENGAFVRELCDSRTFCRESEISVLRSKGLAKGGTLGNAIVLEANRVKNSGGLRLKDECVRHKMLDAMGDLSLAGGPILGAFSSNCGGHTLTNRLLRAAFSDPAAIDPFKIDRDQVFQLPGFGLKEQDFRRLV